MASPFTPSIWQRAPVGALPIFALLIAWEVAARSGVYSRALFPSPEEVWLVYRDDTKLIFEAIGASLARVVVGVSLAAVTAIPAGLLLGRYPALLRLCDWIIQVFRCFPGIALIPLAILFFGIGDKPAIILIWLSAFWPLLINTIFGVSNVERTLLRVARAAHASEFRILREILLPGALPAILTGLRLAAGNGWLTVVTAEMIAVRSGLGYLIMYAQTVFRADQVVACIVAIGAIGFCFDLAIRSLRARLCRWQEGLVMST